MKSSEFNVGDIVYAYAFKETESRDQLRYIQKPILGILTKFNHPDNEQGELFKSQTKPRYFVPFKKNSTSELAWSKSVQASARHYEQTEAKAIQEFNEIIKKVIRQHEGIIANWKDYII